MTRKATKRKHYAIGSVISVAIRRASYIGDDMLEELRAKEADVLAAFMSGTATVDDWRTLADVMNISETMADHGIGPEALVATQAMQCHLLEAQQRYEKTKRMGLTGLGLQAVRDLLEFYDLQRTSIPFGKYVEMTDATENRIRSSHPKVKVLV